MYDLIIYIFGYLFLLMAWGAFLLIICSLSYLIKKNLTVIVNYIYVPIGLLIVFFPLFIVIKTIYELFVQGAWAWLVVGLFFFGTAVGALQNIYMILLVPFYKMSEFALNKYKILSEGPSDLYEAEVITPDGEVLYMQSDRKVNNKIALWLICNYVMVIGRGILMQKVTNMSPLDILVIDSLVIATISGVIYCIILFWRSVILRKRQQDWRPTAATSLKIFGIVYLFFWLLELAYL